MIEKLVRFLADYETDILSAAEEMMDTPMPELTEALFSLYEIDGSRTPYEKVYFRRREYLTVAGMNAWLLRKRAADDHRFTAAVAWLEMVITGICSEDCWALPAHVDRKNNPHWAVTVELFASETAQTLAELITLFKDALWPEIYDLARKEIYRRVLYPFFTSSEPYDWWEHCDLNWCAVCNGSIGCVCLDLMQDEPEELGKCLERLVPSLDHYLGGFSEDGACLEGLGYYTYGLCYFTGFAQKLKDYTKGRVDLMDNDKVHRIARFQQLCYFPGGRTVSFSDGDSRDHFRVGLTARFCMEFPDVSMPELSGAAGLHTDGCYRFMNVYHDFIWTCEYIDKMMAASGKYKDSMGEDNAANTFLGQHVLKDAQWVVAVSKNGCGLAAKGGHNDEPHNHNDVGSFMYLLGEDILLDDLGAGEYTKAYFNEGRYDIFCNQSFSHNVPIINGQPQAAGRRHCCSAFAADEWGKTILSFANAYSEGLIDKLTRTLDFNCEDGVLSVIDAFVPSKATQSFTENLISIYPPVIEGHRFFIRGASAGYAITVEGSNLRVVTVDHTVHGSGEHISVYCMRWDVPVESGGCEFCIEPAVQELVRPVEQE